MAYYIRKSGGLSRHPVPGVHPHLCGVPDPAGDPALVILGVDADPLQIEQLHQEMGIDQPIHIRFLSWIGGVLQGDLGTSYRYPSLSPA